MNETDFKQTYSLLEERVKASDDLKARTKKLISLEENADQLFAPKCGRASRTCDPPRFRRSIFSAFGVRAQSLCAACFLVVVCAVLFFGTGTFDRVSFALSGNSFELSAYADEAQGVQSEIANLAFEAFHPQRSSAGYLYNIDTDSVDRNTVVVSRSYAFNMSVTGNKVKSLSYTINGSGATYSSWKTGDDNDGSVAQAPTTTFDIAFNNGEALMREINLDYHLDGEEKAKFDVLYQRGQQSQEDRDYSTNMEVLLAQCDAARLNNTTLTITATFEDGKTQTKVYGFEPQEGFETAYATHLQELAQREKSTTTDQVSEPSLFKLVEKEIK